MVLEYFSSKKAKKQEGVQTPKTPILNEEDEKFLNQITYDEAAPPLPARPVVITDNGTKVEGKDAQIALMDGADKVALPQSPPVEDAPTDKKGKKKAEVEKKARDYWGFASGLPARMKTISGRKKAADDIQSAADGLKTGTAPADQEVKKEADDLTAVLDQLNLAAVNNRVFSFSKESQELMDKFKQVLKDLINGVPTAYDDLEKLLTRSESQLSKTFTAMPPFIQTLVKSLPAKVTASLGPEFMAAAAEKPSLDAPKKSKLRLPMPSLKTLVGTQGAVVTMLRSIVNFLKFRFPAVVGGTNVLLSLAIFLLLFVFWYCHKRGRETRLEKERLAAEQLEGGASESDMSDMEDSAIEEATRQAREQGRREAAQGRTPGASDFPSVMDLPSPALTPLPNTPGAKAEEKKLGDPILAGSKA